MVGLLLGVLFIYTSFNLRLPILAHGFIDTILLAIIYLDKDQRLKRLLIRT